jgi:hypothetical protein
VVEGNAAALLDPAKTIVQVDTVNNADAKQKLLQSNWSTVLLESNNVLRLQMDKAAIPALIKDMTDMSIGVLSVQPRHSLEDYFLSLTTQQPHAHTAAN